MTNRKRKLFSLLRDGMQRIITIRWWIFCGVMWIINDNLTRNIVTFSHMTMEKTTPAIYAFIQSNAMYYLFYLFGVLCLFSDVPFCRKYQMYICLRTGKKRWYWRQIFYVFMTALIAILTGIVSCLMQLHNCLKISLQWDRLLGTLAYTDAGMQCRIPIAVSNRIIAHYSPNEIFWISVLIGFGVTVFIGIFLFVISLCISRKAALLIASSMVLMCSLHDYYPAWIRYISPVFWIRSTNLGMTYTDHAPGLLWVCICLPTVIICFIFTGYITFIKRDFEWEEEY